MAGDAAPQGPAGIGTSILSRAARGSLWTSFNFIGLQAARFASNLILARLLFPEAFGVMALVTVIMVGLMMISDMGIAQSVMHSPRGDDPAFLDTAWMLQIARGVVLWLAACALAYPAAVFYDQPLLTYLLPVAAVALPLRGCEPMRVETANRHLLLGRVMTLDLAAQICGIAVMVLLAWITGSLWALVAGSVAPAALRLALMWLYLPGAGNRLRWERAAGDELLRFGIWIFLSSVAGLLVAQGDKAILGKFLTIGGLGVYNIGMFLATFPMLLGTNVTSRVLIPVYREHLNSPDTAARERLFRIRYFVTGGLLAALFVLALAGPWLVQVLYDDRYIAAGGVIVALACVQMVVTVSLTYDQAALAVGDSRGFFRVSAIKAVLSMGGFLFGVSSFGLFGALLGMGLALLAYHPFIAVLAVRHKAWDKRHDLLFVPVALVLAGVALWLNWPAVMALMPSAESVFHSP